jgi:hypothetical protein
LAVYSGQIDVAKKLILAGFKLNLEPKAQDSHLLAV